MDDPLRRQLQTTLGAAYTLERELGGGGMSRVFLAREEALEREVVVKVLAPELAVGLSAERFAREIKLAAVLQEPHIVPLLAAGVTADGLPYYTMPFVRGESLRARLAQGPVPLAESVSVLRDVLRALAYAHRQGVVHRDIKPENVLLHEGTAVVTDFGIAKALSASKTQAPGGPAGAPPTATLTQLGTSLGTPAYMAPEQAVGDTVDARADVYAWGVIAYELLAGRHPFAGRTTAPQLIAAHIGETPLPLHEMAPAVPPALAGLVMRCLAKNPTARPGSAAELLTALDAGPVGPAGGAPRTSRVRARLAVGAVGVLLAAAGGLVWQARRRAEAPSTPTQATASAPVALAVLPFENRGDTADAYFADGITDEVRGKLAGLPGLRVIAGGSSRPYRGTTKPPAQIARELGVRYLLVGTVRWQKRPGGPSRVRVDPELVDAAGGPVPTTRWQQAFDAELADVFQLQADIARRVADTLRVALGAPERQALAAQPTRNLEAYDAYLRGQYYWQGAEGFLAPTLERAVAAFAEAVARDPDFALAWASLAWTQAGLYERGSRTPAIADSARRAAERAAALAPDRAEPHMARAAYEALVRRDSRRALDAIARVLAAAPNDATLLAHIGMIELRLGRYDAAVGHLRTAAQLEPRLISVGLATAELYVRDYPGVRAATERGLAVDPGDLTLRLLRAMADLGEGRLAGARAVLGEAPATTSPAALAAQTASAWGGLAWALDPAAQRLVTSRRPDAFAGDRAAWGLALAQTHALLGDSARARAYADSARAAYEAGGLLAGPETQANYALALALAGRREGAVREALRAEALQASAGNAFTGPSVHHLVAQAYVVAGKPARALDALERALRGPGFLSSGWLRIDPNYAPLRGDPRFERLIGG